MNFDEQLSRTRQRMLDALQLLDKYAQTDAPEQQRLQQLYVLLQEAVDDYFMIVTRRLLDDQ